jgi:hypothetical protein
VDAPLPPHERPWRHPSELGPPAHEPTSASGRVLIATTATLSLLLIGLLALSMTPGRDVPPIAVGSTTEQPTARAVALERPAVPMVTPLGDEGWGVTTAEASRTSSGRMAARLPSGAVVDVHVVRHDEESGVTLVSLPTRTDGYELATDRPAPSDTVVVQGLEPMVVSMFDIPDLDVAEGAPILDSEGDLVGLCTWDGDAVAVMTVPTMPGEPATTSAPATTSVAATVTTVPASAPVATTAPPAATTSSISTSTTGVTSPAATTTVAPTTSSVSAGGGATTAPG